MSDKKEEKYLAEENRRLKEKVRGLVSENKKLKSEIQTLEDAWYKTQHHIKEMTKNKKLEDLIGANDKKSSTQNSGSCSQCYSEKVRIIKRKNSHMMKCLSCGSAEKINE
jgi:regulator of replication initiation timing